MADQDDGGALLDGETTNTNNGNNKWTLSSLVQNRIVQATGIVIVLLFAFFAGSMITLLIFQTLEAPGNNNNNNNNKNKCLAPPPFVNHFENDTDSVWPQHVQQVPLLLSNVIILDNAATPALANAMDILIVSGKIAQIGGMGSLRVPPNAVTINGQGRYISSGTEKCINNFARHCGYA